jgi:cytoskeletal protein RodZ
MAEENIKNLLDQAIQATYVDLELADYNFNEEEQTYDIELTHKKTNKTIRIGFRDKAKKRNFDLIPLYVVNAPLGLIEIFTTFVHVYWDSKQNNRTMMESLAAMVTDEMADLDIPIKEEKLVQ